MRQWFYIVVVLIVSISLSAGCQKDEDAIANQQTSTVRFLESGHTPRLISEEAARESLDDAPEYYSVFDNETYRYIATMYADGRDRWTEIEAGDLVAIYFNAYVFTYSSISNTTMPYWSNRPEVIASLEITGGGLDSSYWSSEPLELRAGGDVLAGLSRALIGCREGDDVEVYMTSPAAYGNSIVGLVPKESPVAWYFVIVGVTKQ